MRSCAILLVAVACTRSPSRAPIESARASERPQQPVDAGVTVVPRDAVPHRVTVTATDTCGMMLPTIVFPVSSAVPDRTQSAVIDRAADMLKCFRRDGDVIALEVRGFADARELDPLALSKLRAQYVTAELVKRGIAADTLVPTGNGAKPTDPNSTELGRAENRRVELIVRGHRPPP